MSKKIDVAAEVMDTLQLYESAPRDGGMVGEMLVATVNGTMRVCPFEDWIALQFQDLELVKSLPGGEFNKHSGKWNIHANVTGEAGKEWVLKEFNRRLGVIGCRKDG